MNSYLPKILITGSNGQVGASLRQHSAASDFHLAACTREELDISDMASVQRALAAHTPDIIINTAAYTAVDKAEQEQQQCDRANHIGPRNLAIACRKQQIPLIHLSTDYIFPGTQSVPYREDDRANPVNYYGAAKWLGEQAIQEQCEQYIILRVSGVFSEHGSNFPKTILRLARERKQLRIVADQITCPTYAGDIAGTIFALAKNLSHWGTYHYCSRAPVSWHQFAVAIITEAGRHEKLAVEEIAAITTATFPTAAKRPAYSVLDCGKIEKDYRIRQPSWKKALAVIVPQIL